MSLGYLRPMFEAEGIEVPDPSDPPLSETHTNGGEVTLREHLRRIGSVRSERKAQSSRLNLARAMVKRFPDSPLWKDRLVELETRLLDTKMKEAKSNAPQAGN